MKDRFDVFLCHNSEDKPEVKKIGDQLKHHRLHPWLDEWELRPGFPWQRLLEENIEKIGAVVVFVGPSGIGPWQQLELEAYLHQFVNRKCPVIPVVLKGTSKLPKLPLFLQGMTWVDFRQNEPDPLKRLIWGITGEKRGSQVTPNYRGVHPSHPKENQEITTSNFGDFKAQLGSAQNAGLLSLAERLENLVPDQNPYWTGTSLPANSPVFFGRDQILHQLTAAYRRQGKPPCVSLLGERRIGKSSLLNQVYQGLGQEPGLVSIHASAQNWNQAGQQNFFQHLYQAIRTTLPDVPELEVKDYPGLRDAIAPLSRHYRFLLIIDEFEEMAGNLNFDTFFFSNLRALGDGPEYNFGYLLVSRRPLQELCSQHEIQASKFWNIFGMRRVLDLLEESEAHDLVVRPITHTLTGQTAAEMSRLWQESIKPFTGSHPALIQIAAADHWDALAGGYAVDAEQLEINLREYLQDLWYRRTPEEWQLLIRATAGRALPSTPLTTDLRLRGLLTAEGQPFSQLFRQVIGESLPLGKSLEQAADDIDKGLEKAKKIIDHLTYLVRQAGKLWQALHDPDGEGSGE